MPLGHAFSLVVILGAAVGLMTEVDPGAAAAVMLACAALAYGCRSHVRIAAVLAGIAAMSASGASAARIQSLSIESDGGSIGRREDEPNVGLVLVKGRLARDAVMMPDGTARLLIDVSTIARDADPIRVRFRVQAYVGGRQVAPMASEWMAGRWIRAPMSLRHPAVLQNPGGWSPQWQALTRGFHLSGTIKSAWVVTVRPGPWWTELIGASRRAIRQAIVVSTAGRSAETRSVVAAILIGDRGEISDEVEARLQRAGTYHVIAISGGNVALLVVAAILLVRLLLRAEGWRSAAVLVVVLAYGLLAGGEPSVNRAVTAAALYLIARAAGIAPSATHVVALVASLVTLAAPLEVLRPGAWLSYGATLGIILFAGEWSRGGLAHGPLLRTWVMTLGRAVAGVLAATAAAELILLPVSAAIFGRVGVAGLLLNFIAIPAMAVVQASGMAAVAASFVWVPGAQMCAAISELGVAAILESARLVDVAPWLSWRVAAPAWPWIAAFYVTLTVTWVCRRNRLRLRVGAVATAVCGMGLLLSPERGFAGPSGATLRLTMLDVGQGESLLIQFPSGQSLLVDAGHATPAYDVGERVVVSALEALGVRRLDWLAVTHANLDHIGGAQAVATALDVREVWEAVPVPQSVPWKALRESVISRGGAWRQLRTEDRLDVGAVSIDVLHPPRPDWERQKARNDDSLVLRMRYRNTEVLLTGDIGTSVEHALPISRERPLRLLRIAHHGSRSSSGEAFVGQYDPIGGLISVGAGNVFGHPAPAVLERLSGRQAQVFRTDRSGAIILETDGVGIRVRTWAGETWRAALWRSSS